LSSNEGKGRKGLHRYCPSYNLNLTHRPCGRWNVSKRYMKKGICMTFFILLRLSCFPQPKVNEDFNVFFKQFNQSKSFQIERIVFPLSLIHGEYISESGKKEVFQIAKKEWSFSDFSKSGNKKQIITQKSQSENNFIVTHQIIDTGVFIQYFFKKQQGKWFLYQISDDST
jgi:hypothetical protein